MNALSGPVVEKLAVIQGRLGRPFDLTVTGFSMNPALYEGDVVTVQGGLDYKLGDILVFLYPESGLLIHRLLKIANGRYYCKGDNSFRLEDMPPEQIIGKVVLIGGRTPPPCPPRLISLSIAVNRRFRKSGYSIEETKRSRLYGLYEKAILNKGDDIMVYQKNTLMEYITVDDESLTVFDPESGDVHFFDRTGIDILNTLDEPRDLAGVLSKLCETYDASPGEIEADVLEFLEQAAEKRVVVNL